MKNEHKNMLKPFVPWFGFDFENMNLPIGEARPTGSKMFGFDEMTYLGMLCVYILCPLSVLIKCLGFKCIFWFEIIYDMLENICRNGHVYYMLYDMMSIMIWISTVHYICICTISIAFVSIQHECGYVCIFLIKHHS